MYYEKVTELGKRLKVSNIFSFQLKSGLLRRNEMVNDFEKDAVWRNIRKERYLI